MADYPKRGEIYWIQLDPTVGTEIQKTRPCLILSNNSQNKKGTRVIAAPITSKLKTLYPFEAKLIIKGRTCLSFPNFSVDAILTYKSLQRLLPTACKVLVSDADICHSFC